MPALPTTVDSTPTNFTPAFKYVAQTNDFDDVVTCVATIAGKAVEEVREIAIAKIRHPARGPYYLSPHMIQSLFAQFHLVASVYKYVEKVAQIPDVALVLVDYHPEMETGRHVIFHRAFNSHSSGSKTEYIIDPATWCKPSDRVRTGFKDFEATWVIGIHAMNEKAGSAK